MDELGCAPGGPCACGQRTSNRSFWLALDAARCKKTVGLRPDMEAAGQRLHGKEGWPLARSGREEEDLGRRQPGGLLDRCDAMDLAGGGRRRLTAAGRFTWCASRRRDAQGEGDRGRAGLQATGSVDAGSRHRSC
ncbi:hypothetical protein D1007_13217 [Hordeum vulgare]|nr:hypothetical protein D1007_13217 [Hordeum vulgare]